LPFGYWRLSAANSTAVAVTPMTNMLIGKLLRRLDAADQRAPRQRICGIRRRRQKPARTSRRWQV
jgi:hypothetical protein